MTDPSEVSKEEQEKLDELEQSIAQTKLLAMSIERQMNMERAILSKQIAYQKKQAYVAVAGFGLALTMLLWYYDQLTTVGLIIVAVCLVSLGTYNVIMSNRLMAQSNTYYDEAVENGIILKIDK